MSIGYSNAVWNGHPEIKGGKRLVLLSLCDRANEGGACFPSVKDICKRCCLSKRQVQRHLKELEEQDKLISKKLQKGRNGVNVYTLTFPPIGVTSTSTRSDVHDTQGVMPMTPKPSKNHQRTKYIYEQRKQYGTKQRSEREQELAKAF